jgi:hypothetical protein
MRLHQMQEARRQAEAAAKSNLPPPTPAAVFWPSSSTAPVLAEGDPQAIGDMSGSKPQSSNSSAPSILQQPTSGVSKPSVPTSGVSKPAESNSGVGKSSTADTGAGHGAGHLISSMTGTR